MTKKNRTQEKIMNSLLILMERKPLEQISMSEIAEKAQINRTTLYRHFEDKYHIIEEREILFFSEFAASFKTNYQQSLSEHLEDRNQKLIQTLKVIEKHRFFLKIMLGPNGEMSFNTQLQQILKDIFYKRETLVKEVFTNLDITLTQVYHSQALIGIINYWANHDDLDLIYIYNFISDYTSKILVD